MNAQTCAYCGQKFQPSRYRPDQKICSSADCQRRRRTEYHQKKVSTDPAYRDQCHDSQRKWRDKNPQYMKRYLANRRLNPKKSRLDHELRRLQQLLKNNVAVDLSSLDATVWLIPPPSFIGVKNILAKATLIVIEGLTQPISSPEE
jgi:hypothetical protein